MQVWCTFYSSTLARFTFQNLRRGGRGDRGCIHGSGGGWWWQRQWWEVLMVAVKVVVMAVERGSEDGGDGSGGGSEGGGDGSGEGQWRRWWWQWRWQWRRWWWQWRWQWRRWWWQWRGAVKMVVKVRIRVVVGGNDEEGEAGMGLKGSNCVFLLNYLFMSPKLYLYTLLPCTLILL